MKMIALVYLVLTVVNFSLRLREDRRLNRIERDLAALREGLRRATAYMSKYSSF